MSVMVGQLPVDEIRQGFQILASDGTQWGEVLEVVWAITPDPDVVVTFHIHWSNGADMQYVYPALSPVIARFDIPDSNESDS